MSLLRCRPGDREHGQYLFHLPRQGKSYLGLGCHRIIRYRRDGFLVQTGSGVEHYPAADAPSRGDGCISGRSIPEFLDGQP